jgi:hypothetical protein
VQWNGSAWSSLALPDTSARGALPRVEGVGRTPSGDEAWVVGYVRTPYPTDQMPLIIRWRDGAWDEPESFTLRPQIVYPFSARGGLAYDVTAISTNDVWVVGTATGYGDASATSVPMALHYDGSTWTDVPVPLIGNRHHELDAVSASAPDNVWAVGDWRSISAPFKALIVRWDGSSWTRVSNPGEGAGSGGTQAVLALAPDDVWVSGEFYGGSVRLIHWNGSSWETPSTGITGIIVSFAAISPRDIWAADGTHASIYHYDGTSWSLANTPTIPGAAYTLRGWGMDAIDTCGVWAVGGYSDGGTQLTLAERPMPGVCPADFNSDGSLDFFDYDDFVACFEGAACPPGADADFNADGSVDFFDYDDFSAAFETGC